MNSTKTCQIAFQGAPGAFSHQAAAAFSRRLAPDSAHQYIACQTFGEVFERVGSDGVYGAIPLENSSVGSIVVNYDLLWATSALIVAEVIVPIHLHIIGLPGADFSDITEVYSHPAALDQCRILFKDNPRLSPRVYWDTSGAVAYVKESLSKEKAAIGSELAASEFSLPIIKTNVEDYAHNSTRFGLICDAKTIAANFKDSLTVPYKLSLAVELTHKPGSLATLLWGISQFGINLTKIDSRPVPETPWHYRFFMDIEIDRPDKEERLLSTLARASASHKILGRYNQCPYA